MYPIFSQDDICSSGDQFVIQYNLLFTKIMQKKRDFIINQLRYENEDEIALLA